MHDMPTTVDAALSSAQKLETVEAAQKRLHQGKLSTESLGVQLESSESAEPKSHKVNLVHQDNTDGSAPD